MNRPGVATRGTASLLLALLAPALFAPAAAQGQSAPGVRAEARYQSFSFDDPDAASIETLSLLSLPFSARAALSPLVDLSVSGAWARGSLEHGSESSTIAAFTDTQLALGVTAGWARISAIALLPTGQSTQTLDESRVAGAIAADLLPFAVSNWGAGAGGGLDVSAARPVGPLGVGLAVAYLARASFEPTEEEDFAYRPGNLLRVTAAVDGTVGESGKATAQVTWHRHGEDEFRDENLFRSGDRLRVLGSYAFPVGAGSNGLAYAGVIRRERGTFLDSDATSASQNLVLVGGGLRLPMAGGVLQPDVEARVFRRSDGLDEGYDIGVGADFEISGPGRLLVPSLRAHFGRLEVRDDVQTGFTGFEVGFSARFGGGGS